MNKSHYSHIIRIISTITLVIFTFTQVAWGYENSHLRVQEAVYSAAGAEIAFDLGAPNPMAEQSTQADLKVDAGGDSIACADTMRAVMTELFNAINLENDKELCKAVILGVKPAIATDCNRNLSRSELHVLELDYVKIGKTFFIYNIKKARELINKYRYILQRMQIQIEDEIFNNDDALNDFFAQLLSKENYYDIILGVFVGYPLCMVWGMNGDPKKRRATVKDASEYVDVNIKNKEKFRIWLVNSGLNLRICGDEYVVYFEDQLGRTIDFDHLSDGYDVSVIEQNEQDQMVLHDRETDEYNFKVFKSEIKDRQIGQVVGGRAIYSRTDVTTIVFDQNGLEVKRYLRSSNDVNQQKVNSLSARVIKKSDEFLGVAYDIYDAMQRFDQAQADVKGAGTSAGAAARAGEADADAAGVRAAAMGSAYAQAELVQGVKLEVVLGALAVEAREIMRHRTAFVVAPSAGEVEAIVSALGEMGFEANNIGIEIITRELTEEEINSRRNRADVVIVKAPASGKIILTGVNIDVQVFAASIGNEELKNAIVESL